ncbi:MAG: hypothetical protein ABI321_01505 [Polyangia bacterium]
MRRLAALVLFGSLAGCTSASNKSIVGLDDVSFLFPLSADPGRLLAPKDGTAYGPLLSSADLSMVPQLVQGEDARSNDDVLGEARVVAARLDICSTDAAGCEPEVRLVFQPVLTIGGTTSTRDAAIHAIYRLGRADLLSLSARVLALRDHHDATEGLSVHPTMLAEGVDGPYATALKALLLEYVGTTNLSRMAFFEQLGDSTGGVTPDGPPAVGGEAQQWRMEALDVHAGQYTPEAIGSTTTEFFTRTLSSSADEDTRTGELIPEPVAMVSVSSLYDAQAASADGARLDDGAAKVLRLENPRLEKVDDNSCVSCHSAFAMGAWSRSHAAMPETGDAFTSRYSLVLPSDDTVTTHSLRAFGYFGGKPAISQRAVNHTALVAETLDKALR